jgi:glycosyltransferase involved in cell wall biosynthesis
MEARRDRTDRRGSEPCGPNIWYLVTSLERGGPHPIVDLGNALVERGFSVTIWTLIEDHALTTELDERIRIETVGITHKYEVWKLRRFLRALLREGPDILQSQYFHDGIVTRLVSLAPFDVVTVCAVVAVYEDRALHRALLERLLRGAPSYYVSNSKAGKQATVQKGVDPAKIEVIHNGRDPERYAQPEESVDRASSFGIPEEAFVVGSVCRLVEGKGIQDLIEAVSRLPREDVYILLVGDGPHRRHLEQQVEDLDLKERVVFTGMRDDVPALLDCMDLFVLPSYREGLPSAVIEAMLARCPVVATPVGGVPELIDDGVTGRLVSSRSPESLAEAVRSLLENAAERERLAENAFQRAAEEFSSTVRIERYERFYRRIASED